MLLWLLQQEDDRRTNMFSKVYRTVPLRSQHCRGRSILGALMVRRKPKYPVLKLLDLAHREFIIISNKF
jgi:hypothetical protein